MRKIWTNLKRDRNIRALVISLGLAYIWLFITNMPPQYDDTLTQIIYKVLVLSLIVGGFFVYPFALTFLNLKSLFHKADSELRKAERRTEVITISLGCIYSLLYDGCVKICYRIDWNTSLYIGYNHTPIWTKSVLTIIICSCIGVVGYLLLSCRNINRTPPLVAVFEISAIYIGILMCTLWMIQVFPVSKLYCLFPFNCILIGTRTIQCAIKEWQTDGEKQARVYKNKFLYKANKMLMDSSRWPGAAFLLMWPFLGILIAVLVLFGQQPDYIIKAWTETCDWGLSQRTTPHEYVRDEHYLCTVAAQGHAEVVKPLRPGLRHGHLVTVNRQLCIANAFEQVLEEQVPWLHRPIRRFYDAYGYPVSRLVHSKYVADMIYFIMKPLEWLFLIVLYLVDVNPENRIAVQYPHAPIPTVCKRKESLF